MEQKRIWKWVSLLFLSLGYIWLFNFKFNMHICIKSLSMQSYLLVWLYFVLQVINIKSINSYHIMRLFQLSFVLQIIVSVMYWLVIHGPMIASKKFPRYQQLWNVYVHIIPMIALSFDFVANKRQLQNNWKDMLVFSVVSFIINILYSLLQRPVYQFLHYNNIIDYIKTIVFIAFMMLVHYTCNWLYKLWKKMDKKKFTV